MKRCLVLAFVGILCLLVSFSEVMAAFPEKPIKLLVGYSPGGTSDLMGRMLGSLVGEYLGQPIVVVNKPGASATIAAAELANSPPDGYTLGNLTILTLAMAPFTLKVTYDPLKSFEPLLNYASSCYGICVRSDAPWNSLQELVEWARKNPGELTMSTLGKGDNNHVAFEWIARQEKIAWKAVPYPGGAASATALLGGHVKANFGTGSHMPFVESGKFKLLVVNSDRRSPQYPNVPTLQELGYKMPVTSANIIVAPKGVPEPILKTLEDAFGKAAKSEAFSAFLKRILTDQVFMDREQTKKLVETEYRAWNEILDKLDMKMK